MKNDSNDQSISSLGDTDQIRKLTTKHKSKYINKSNSYFNLLSKKDKSNIDNSSNDKMDMYSFKTPNSHFVSDPSACNNEDNKNNENKGIFV
mmetsp:Transcript_31795/g.28155  ORF Transcript_31795/g.28155 Transcript_31795/m.28155 type:complete len:92 (+) Transcript_31795:146-421(+)